MQIAAAEVGGRLRSAVVRLVIGTRPEAIKLAPVVDALARRGITPRLVLTGQHSTLDPGEFGLAGHVAERLCCPGTANPDDHVQAVVQAMVPRLDGTDLLIVQGDTSSALGGALAGFAADVPVAHVEAGLRTHDLALPWPEEGYRIAIDARAALLFAPTEVGAGNLRAERAPGRIHVTGNSGIDALLRVARDLPPQRSHGAKTPHLLVTCHRRESWGDGLRDIAAALLEIVAAGLATADVLLHPNAHVARSMHELLGDCLGIRLRQPMGHAALVQAMRDCTLILSDSGGIQEEAPALGTPLLVLRTKTERPEGVASGNMLLVGTDRQRIVTEVRWLLTDRAALAAMARPALPYGDGRASPRIAAIVDDWLAERRAARQVDPVAAAAQLVQGLGRAEE